MYPVDLENNERSYEYSAIVLFTKHPRPARINKIYRPNGYLSPLTTGRMTPSGTNSQPAELSTQL